MAMGLPQVDVVPGTSNISNADLSLYTQLKQDKLPKLLSKIRISGFTSGFIFCNLFYSTIQELLSKSSNFSYSVCTSSAINKTYVLLLLLNILQLEHLHLTLNRFY
jgi:hypothetical protein